MFIYFRWYIHKQNCILIFQTKKIEFLVKLLRCSVAICKFTKWILYKVKTFKELQNAPKRYHQGQRNTKYSLELRYVNTMWIIRILSNAFAVIQIVQTKWT